MAKAKVFVADDVNEDRLAPLREAGIEVIKETKLDPSQLKKRLKDADAVIVRSATNITADVMDAAEKLRAVGRAGVGVDNIDVPAATARGIVVMNAPDGNTITTAEHTVALLVSLARNVPHAHGVLQEGTWDKKRFVGVELNGKTLGVIGLGRIGRHVAKIAKGFGMTICGYDPFISEENAKETGISLEPLETVLAKSDFITIHTPVTDETRGMIGPVAFSKMKDGVRIVNCARGGLINEEALLEAIENGKVAGAALDVFEKEPLDPDSPLLGHPRIITTPHLGASTQEAQDGVAVTVAEQIRDYLISGELRNAVNAPSMEAAELEALEPYIDLAASLGHFHEQILGHTAIKEVDIVFSGQLAEADCGPVTRALVSGLLSKVSDRINVVNALHIAEERGISVVTSLKQAANAAGHDITSHVITEDEEQIASGAVFGDGVGRITQIGDFALEVIPSGYMLFTKNDDEPGAIGKIGSLLGDHGVNISRFYLGRNEKGGEALAVIEIDSPLENGVLEALRQTDSVLSARQVKL
ncbi:MAG: phosphoglycerate dehydrogenase [Pyrinomonadaceae bacterium]|nr:phosphoglycerate dehydrogenase [Pyrinomonadaceae bacterium]